MHYRGRKSRTFKNLITKYHNADAYESDAINSLYIISLS